MLQDNNKGLTLVELIVAMAISSIVIGGITLLLVQSVKMYTHETSNAKLEMSISQASNNIIDNIMESRGAIISTSTVTSKTDYALFGNFTINTPGVGAAATTYDVTKGYLYTFNYDGVKGYGNILVDNYAVSGKTIAEIKTDVEGKRSLLITNNNDPNNYKKNVLASQVSNFLIKPVDECLVSSGTDHMYIDPLKISFTLENRDNSGNVADKHVNEQIFMRNHLEAEIYYNDGTGGITYACPNVKTALNDTKVKSGEVKLSYNLGDIEVPGDYHDNTDIEERYKRPSITVLEVVPDYDHSLTSFTVGGQSPYDDEVMDALVNDKTGDQYDFNKTNFQVNANTTMPAYYVIQARFDGYFEYVGPGNGLYALDESSLNDVDAGGYVTTPKFFSRIGENSLDQSAFCWKWVETDTDSGNKVTKDQIITAISNDDVSFKIGVHDYIKNKYFANDSLICASFVSQIEGYTLEADDIRKIDEGTLDESTAKTHGTVDYLHGIYNFEDKQMGTNGQLSYIQYTAAEFRKIMIRHWGADNTVEDKDHGVPTGESYLDSNGNPLPIVKTKNYEAVRKWKIVHRGGIKVVTLTPQDLIKPENRKYIDSDTEKATLVVFAMYGQDGCYTQVDAMYDRVYNKMSSYSGTDYPKTSQMLAQNSHKNYSASNDIDFAMLKSLYYNIIKEDQAIVVGNDICTNVSAPYISSLMKMLFLTSNESYADSSLKQKVLNAEKSYKEEKRQIEKGYDAYPDEYMSNINYDFTMGSGRDFYAKFFEGDRDDSGNSYATVLADGITNQSFAYINSNGDLCWNTVSEGDDLDRIMEYDNVPPNANYHAYKNDRYSSGSCSFTDWTTGNNYINVLTLFANPAYKQSNTGWLNLQYNYEGGPWLADGLRDNFKQAIAKQDYVYYDFSGNKIVSGKHVESDGLVLYNLYKNQGSNSLGKNAVYRNMATWNSDCTLLTFDKSGARGMTVLSSTIKTVNEGVDEDPVTIVIPREPEVKQKRKIGTIKFVGAGTETPDGSKGVQIAKNTPYDSVTKMFSERGVIFNLPANKTGVQDTDPKVIYINESQYRDIVNNNQKLYAYAVIRSSEGYQRADAITVSGNTIYKVETVSTSFKTHLENPTADRTSPTSATASNRDSSTGTEKVSLWSHETSAGYPRMSVISNFASEKESTDPTTGAVTTSIAYGTPDKYTYNVALWEYPIDKNVLTGLAVGSPKKLSVYVNIQTSAGEWAEGWDYFDVVLRDLFFLN